MSILADILADLSQIVPNLGTIVPKSGTVGPQPMSYRALDDFLAQQPGSGDRARDDFRSTVR